MKYHLDEQTIKSLNPFLPSEKHCLVVNLPESEHTKYYDYFP